MMDFFKRFFSNKFNIVLTITQVIAILLFVLGNVWGICLILGIVMEGVFFIMLGIKTLFANKDIVKQESILESLPMQKSDVEVMEKSNKRQIKSNKSQAVLCIIMGILLVFLVLF